MLNRRIFLQRTLATSVITMAASSGLLVAGRAVAAWNQAAFDAKDMTSAMKGSIGTDNAEESDKVKIKAPDIAENGAVVPVTVSSTLENVDTITLFSEKNGTPLVANYKLGDNAEAFVSTRIKMGKTSHVVAVVSSGGKNFMARKEVKVTIGGCGG